jgi:hypothetical protein
VTAILLLVGGYYGYRTVKWSGDSEKSVHQETARMMDAFLQDEKPLIESVGGEEELRSIRQSLSNRSTAPSNILRRFIAPEHQADRLADDAGGRRGESGVRFREARSFAGKFFDPYLYSPVCLLLLLAAPFFLLRRRGHPEEQEVLVAALFALVGALVVQSTRGYTNYRYVYVFLGPAILAVVAFIDQAVRDSPRRISLLVLAAVAFLVALGPMALLEYLRDPVAFSARQWEVVPERLVEARPHFPPRQVLRKLCMPMAASDDEPPVLGMELHITFRQVLWILGLVPDIGGEDSIRKWRLSDLRYGKDPKFFAFFLGRNIRNLPPGKILDTHLEDHYHYYARRHIYLWRDPRINFLDREETIARVKQGRIGHGMIFSPTLDPRLSHRWLTRYLGVRYLLVQSDQLMQFVFEDRSRFFANLDLVASPLINLRNTVVLYELRDEDAIDWEKAL